MALPVGLGSKQAGRNHVGKTPVDVRFTPNSGHCRATVGCPLCANSGHSPIKVMSEIRRLPLLRGSLTERVLFSDRNEVALQALLDSRHSAIWLVCPMSTVRLF